MADISQTTRPQTTDGTPVEVNLHGDVLEEMIYNGAWRADRLAVGLLFGHPHKDADGTRFVVVEGFFAGAHVDDSSDFAAALRVEWKAARAEIAGRFNGAQIVGWYAAGAQATTLSEQATLVIHNTFFTLPWQVFVRMKVDTPDARRVVDGQWVDATVGTIARPA